MNKLFDLECALINNIKSMKEREEIKMIEKDIFSNADCLLLIDNFQKSLNDYNFALKIFKKDSGEVKNKQKELYQNKLNMDNHPLIKKYNDLLVIINEPLYYLEFNLFSLFRGRK